MKIPIAPTNTPTNRTAAGVARTPIPIKHLKVLKYVLVTETSPSIISSLDPWLNSASSPVSNISSLSYFLVPFLLICAPP